MQSHLVNSLAAAGVLALAASTASAQAYLDLGRGQVTGIDATGTQASGSDAGGPFKWTRIGGVVNLPGASDAVGISLDGNTLTGTVNSNAGLWTQATGWVDLGGVPGSAGGCPNLSSPYAVNGDGTVAVGLAWDTCADAFGFKWTPAGGMEELPTLGPNSSRANAVSGDGLTIGGWDEATTGPRRAKLWFDDGTQLLPLEGQPNNLEGIGEVWGFTTDGSIAVGGSFEGAFSWTAAGGVDQLGELIPGGGATAYAVSDDGMIIVGSSGNFFTGTTAFIWIEGQGMMALTDYAADQGVFLPPGTAMGFALDMSPDGKTIVGQAGVFPFSSGFVLTTRTTDVFNPVSGPVNAMGLTGAGESVIGSSITLTTSNVAPGTNYVLTGFSQTATETPFLGGTLLIDLAPRSSQKTALAGRVPAGSLTGAASQGRLLRSAAIDGVATRTVRIPNDPSLIGQVFYAQSLARDPGQPQGWALSNGVRIVISAP